MKFLCLCYYDIEKFAQLSPQALEALAPACQPYDVALRATGKVRALGSFALPDTWRTLRPGQQQPVASMGPLSSAAQQAGAFFIVEADDMDEASAVAAKHAAANYGEQLGFAVEVRPCEMFE